MTGQAAFSKIIRWQLFLTWTNMLVTHSLFEYKLGSGFWVLSLLAVPAILAIQVGAPLSPDQWMSFVAGLSMNFAFVSWLELNTTDLAQLGLNELGASVAVLGSYLMLDRKYTLVQYLNAQFAAVVFLLFIFVLQAKAGAPVWNVYHFLLTSVIPIMAIIPMYFTRLNGEIHSPWMLGWSCTWTAFWCIASTAIHVTWTEIGSGTFLWSPRTNSGHGAVVSAIAVASLSRLLASRLREGNPGDVSNTAITSVAPGIAAVFGFITLTKT